LIRLKINLALPYCFLCSQNRRRTSELRQDLEHLQLVHHRLVGETNGYCGMINRRTLVKTGGTQTSTQDASTYATASEGTPNRRVRFESTHASGQPGGSPPSIGASPVQASAVRNPSPSAQPSNNATVRVVNETGARSKVRGTVLKRTMSGFGGLFRAGAQLERGENIELATIPKDGKLVSLIPLLPLHDP
jgi:hypothetical protein